MAPSNPCFCVVMPSQILGYGFCPPPLLADHTVLDYLQNPLVPFPFSIFLQVCGTSSYLGTVWLPGWVISWATDLNFTGLKCTVLLHQTSFQPPHRTWNQRGVKKQYSLSSLLL